jgi:NADH-quinone oxidoreductase subunit N
MNLAAFAVVIARERETGMGDDMAALNGLGVQRPSLAWPMTIAMLSLAGFPATAGFFGKIYLIEAAVDNGWAWLGVVVVLGSAVSLVYYLRVVAAVWMGASEDAEERPAATPAGAPVIAGGAPEADAPPAPGVVHPEIVVVAVVAAVLTIAIGLYPDPLFDVARDAGEALRNLV